MLYLPDTLVVGSFLGILMFAITGGEWKIVRRSMRIEDTNIEEGTFEPALPKPTSCDI